MKCNLKNFPQTSPEKEKDPEFWSELASDRLHWKQGFEKELREKIREIESQRDDVGTRVTMLRFHTLLLNILKGDSS